MLARQTQEQESCLLMNKIASNKGATPLSISLQAAGQCLLASSEITGKDAFVNI